MRCQFVELSSWFLWTFAFLFVYIFLLRHYGLMFLSPKFSCQCFVFFLFLIHSLYCSNNGNLSSVRALFDNTEALPFFLFQTFFRIFYLQFICLIPYISWYSDSRKFCERDNFWTTLHVFLFFFLFAISVCQREK